MQINCDRFINLYKYEARKKTGYFLIEGKKNITTALENNLKMYLYSVNDETSYEQITKKQMKNITGNNFVEYIGVCRNYEFELHKNEPIIICDNLQDFGNIGCIIRTVYSFGFKNLIFIKDNGDLWNHKTIEASKGLIFKLKPLCCCFEDALKLTGHNSTVLLDMNGENLCDFKPNNKNINIVFGNETHGISEFWSSLETTKLSIPINFESLNVSVAAGISLYHFRSLLH